MRKHFFSCALLLLAATAGMSAQTQRRMTIDELFAMVESGSNALRVSKTQTDVAKRGVEEAKSRRLPDVSASLALSYNGNVLMTDRDFGNAKGFSQPHLGNTFALEAQQVVYAGGALNAGIRMAELQKELSENGVDLTRSQQRFIALGQYLELSKLDNGIKVYDSNIALTQKLIADIKAKQSQGMALRNDVTRYELQMEQLKLGKRRLEDQKLILNHELCNTLNLNADDVTVVPVMDLGNIGNENVSETEMQNEAASLSATLRQSALGMRMADEQLRLAKSELLPKVAVVASETFTGPFTYDIPPIDKNFNIWYVGIGVKYQISSLFKGNKGVRKAKEQVRQSRDTHSLNGEMVDNRVQSAVTLHKQAFAELRTQQKSVELANQNYQVMNDRYLNQLALVTDMVDASNLKLNAELQEVNARINIAYTYYKVLYEAGKLN